MAARKKVRIIRSSKRPGKTVEAVRLAVAQESIWREKFHALVVFEREHGHCDVPREGKLYRALSAWITTQRENAANGALPPEKKAEMEALGVDFTPDDDGHGHGHALEEYRDKLWETRYAELADYHRRFGHTRVTKSWKENPGLAHWRHFQRVLFREGKIDPERKRRLDELGFEWVEAGRVAKDRWQQWEHQWQQQWELLLKFKEEHGHTHVPTGWPENPQLAKWVHRQREHRRNGQLAPDRIARLDAIGFEWRKLTPHFDTAWETRFGQLAEFHRLHGHTRVTKRWTKNPGLGHWRHFQRILYREGKLDPERKRRLDELGFEWVEPDRFGQNRIEQWQNLWERRYAELCTFRMKHGHSDPGIDHSKHGQLAKWVQRQRMKYHTGMLPPDYIQRLEAIRIDWKSEFRHNSDRWERRYAELRAFHERFGHSRVTKSWDENPGLYSWRHHQRELYRAGLLDPRRKARLDALGFDWEEPEGPSLAMRDLMEAQWFEMLERLNDFYEEHGHSNVPKTWPPDQTLANWAAKQRALMRKGLLPRPLRKQLQYLNFKER